MINVTLLPLKNLNILHNIRNNISMICIPPLSPLLYIEKLEFAGGIPIFLIFDTKHRLWVLEMPSQGGSNMYPQPMF